jgi:hypothetical protein
VVAEQQAICRILFLQLSCLLHYPVCNVLLYLTSSEL